MIDATHFRHITITLMILSSFVTCLPASAQNDSNIEGSVVFRLPEGIHYKFFTLTLQDDFFVNKDDGYTNGLGFTFGRGPFLSFSDSNLPGWLNGITKNLYIQTMPNKVRGVAHMFFQRMQTPQDISVAELQVSDIPYAGLLALQSTLYA